LSTAEVAPATLSELSDGELRWLYKLAMGGHAALVSCLGPGDGDKLPSELREGLFKLASAMEQRRVTG
jgi:hypothetical protein